MTPEATSERFTKVPHAVLDRIELSASEKLVLIVLCRYACNKTAECWPSLRTITEKSSLTRNTVRKALKRLEAAGDIEVTQRFEPGTGEPTSNLYRLRARGRAIIDPPGSNIAPQVGQSLTQGRAIIDPELYQLTIPVEKTSSKRDPADFERLWAEYPRKVGKAEARKALQKLVKDGVDIDQVIRATITYSRKVDREGTAPQFVKHCSAFLNSGRWEDFINGDPDAGANLDIVPDDGLRLEGRQR